MPTSAESALRSTARVTASYTAKSTATSAAAAKAGSSAASSDGPVNPGIFVHHIDIFLVVVILVFALFNAPRAIARYARRSECIQGHRLRSVPIARKPRINLNVDPIHRYSDPQRSVLDLDGASSENTHSQHLPYHSSPSVHDEKAPSRSHRPWVTATPDLTLQMWHMPMFYSLILPVSSLLQRRVLAHRSLGQVLLMAGYGVVMLYGGVYRSNPFLDSNRFGWLCVSQLPFIYILATKNNVIGMLVGTGYEKLHYLHRLAGFIAFLAANLHAIGHIYKWNITGTVSKGVSMPANKWGLVALVCFDVLALFSLPFVRSRFYNLFFATHAVGLILILFAVCYHHDVCLPYVLVACVFYGVDHIVRAMKTRIATATLYPIPELGLTRVEVTSINAGWRAGQHVRLRVLSTAMGGWGMTEVHPFTIASVSKSDEGLVLLCKKTGKWTNKLYEMANTSVYGEHGRELGMGIKVMVEGPYGGLGNTVIPSYSGAMFVVGGSGVSFALSTVQDLVRRGNSSNVTDIDVIWSISDPASLVPLIPLFAALVSQCTTARLWFSVYYTRTPSKSTEGMFLPPGINLSPGRAKLIKHLDALVTSTISAGGGCGVFVGVCGPVSLAGSVSETVRCFDPSSKRAVGGVELHEEAFRW